MASAISCGPAIGTSDSSVAPGGVAALRSRATVRSRLGFALCLLPAAGQGAAGASACGNSSMEATP